MRKNIAGRSVVVMVAAALLLAFPLAGRSLAKNRALGAAPNSTLPAVRPMAKVAVVRFPFPPPMMVVDEIGCSPAGNVYAIYSTEPAALAARQDSGRMPVRELPLGGGAIVAFPVPSIPGYLAVERHAFDVDAQGHLYALLEAYPGRSKETGPSDYFIARYDSAGSIVSRVEVHGIEGEQTVPTRFAVLGSGNFVVSGGVFAHGMARAFAGIFDGAGNEISGLTVPAGVESLPFPMPHEPVAVVRKKIAAARAATGSSPLPAPIVLSYSRMATAPNGDVYLLWGTIPPHLDVISPEGTLSSQSDVPLPAAGMKALQIAALNGDRILVGFSAFPANYPVASSIGKTPLVVLDAGTGRALATYELGSGEDDRAIAACAAPSGGFLFLGPSADSKSLALIHYAPQ